MVVEPSVVQDYAFVTHVNYFDCDYYACGEMTMLHTQQRFMFIIPQSTTQSWFMLMYTTTNSYLNKIMRTLCYVEMPY